MAAFLKLTEYKQEGIAIVEDSQGRYLATKQSDAIIPLPDAYSIPQRTQYVQSRSAMMS